MYLVHLGRLEILLGITAIHLNYPSVALYSTTSCLGSLLPSTSTHLTLIATQSTQAHYIMSFAGLNTAHNFSFYAIPAAWGIS